MVWYKRDHLGGPSSEVYGTSGYSYKKVDNPIEFNGQSYDYANAVPLADRNADRQQTIKESFAPGQIYARKISEKNGIETFDTIRVDTKTGTQSFSTTSYNPKDRRGDKPSAESDKAAAADRKKKGRSGLRIALQTDPSQGRLRSGNQQIKKKAGAQGGGKSGLNIPR